MKVLNKLLLFPKTPENLSLQILPLIIRKTFMLFILFAGISQISHSQDYIEFHIDQPTALEVDAGADKTIKKGETVQIGNVSSAKEGNGGYTYEWSPVSGIDVINSANPTTNTEETITYTLLVTDDHECSASDNLKITVESPNTINGQVKNSASFSVYPNPAKNSVFVNLEKHKSQKLTITLLNASGKIVQQKEFETIQRKEIPFNCKNVNPGIYFIQVNNDRELHIQKIILE